MDSIVELTPPLRTHVIPPILSSEPAVATRATGNPFRSRRYDEHALDRMVAYAAIERRPGDGVSHRVAYVESRRVLSRGRDGARPAHRMPSTLRRAFRHAFAAPLEASARSTGSRTASTWKCFSCSSVPASIVVYAV
ncbi:hypothetical protein KTF23_06965 [Burkholderia multivorans]|uniref:hypothetical protein n=2 Tax=Burkholderia multivorans TaxID=87883 RepID=UPI001C2333F7|nr:hypothetical protein [Burkholderia multivorans]MBU9689594.1 hypothetical protein [Burkholderia multivorans]